MNDQPKLIYRRGAILQHFGVSNYTLARMIKAGILTAGRKFTGSSKQYWTRNDIRRADRRLEEANAPRILPPGANRTKGLTEKQKQRARAAQI